MTHLDDCEGNGSGQCPDCDGEGTVIVGWNDDAYENIEAKCSQCGGTGTIRCPACARDNMEDGGALTP
jgi:DnaJ-class molecular chaperone